MAELLKILLKSRYDSLPNLQSPTPPSGLCPTVWELRHELPLHLINFLRDEAEPLLCLAQTSGGTPGKANRPAKYDYNSPLKTVLESPGKLNPTNSENNKKSKKKVKLFSAIKSNGKANKSFSEVEEQLDLRGGSTGPLDGIERLPASPSKQNKNGVSRNAQSILLFSVPEYEQGAGGRRRRPEETPGQRDGKNIKKKLSLSPQTLADFIPSLEVRKNGRKTKTPKSPAKFKSSTPIEDHVVPRLAHDISLKIGKLDLDSADSFPEIGEPAGAAGKKRRMKPTLITNLDSAPVNPIFGQILERNVQEECCSPFKVAEVEKNSYDSREMVRELASMVTPFKQGSSTTGNIKTPNKTPSLSRSNSVASTQSLIPNPSLVSAKEALDVLADVYSYVFARNLMPNLYVELYFVVELLLLDVPQDLESRSDPGPLYLNTLHNCVYFACQVLNKSILFLGYLDQTTLRLLMENKRIAQFSADLLDQLVEIFQSKSVPSPIVNRNCRAQNNVSFLTVSFQSETDNRSNFPNNASFHDFKKQRDKFYYLVRKWGESNKCKDFHFETSLGSEVEKVMAMYQHPVNFYHFSKLFLAQLLAMCRGDIMTGDDQLMAELRRTDLAKYKRLAQRLMTPGRCGGPCPAPAFSGAAEFFRDFLLSCNSPKFVRHLMDLIVSEVKRLDLVVLDVGEEAGVEDSLGWDTSEAFVLVEQFQETLVTLRILGKFLGFLESFPYSSDDLTPDQISCALTVREGTAPCLDVAGCVAAAASSGRLVLTLPWVVEFLSQLDTAAHQLQYYTGLYLQLAVIYQTQLAPLAPKCSPNTAHFLSTYLGWLFENKSFPREVLITAQVTQRTRLALTDQLDNLELVTWGLVIQCCPWVAEVKTLLQTWEGGKRGSQLSLDKTEGSYRKITPLAAPLDTKSKQDKEAVLQSQLEENFFHNQPKSLRRTVEYVSERLASNVIKKIRQNIVPEERAAVVQQMKARTEAGDSTEDIVKGKAEASQKRVKEGSLGLLSDSLHQDCQATLSLLLAFDTGEAARETCCLVAERSVREKVGSWVGQHVTLAYFSREYKIEAERLTRSVSRQQSPPTPPIVFSGDHQPHCEAPSELLIFLKSELKAQLVDRRRLEVRAEDVLAVIARLQRSVQHRADLTLLARRGLGTLSLDWVLSLTLHQPRSLTDSVMESLLSLWTGLAPPQLLNILCPRNLVILSTASDADLSWTKLQQLLSRLILAGLLPPAAVEANCKALLVLYSQNPRGIANIDKIEETLLYLQDNISTVDMNWVNSFLEDLKKTLRKLV